MKKYCAILLILFALAFTACAQNANTGSEAETTPILDILSEEQIKYLTEKLFFTTDAISDMSYEDVNYQLQGTGLELYNPTSGVEINGLDYTVDEEIDYKNLESKADKKITYEEAYAIRLKEKEMRAEDFLEYEFIRKSDKENVHLFFIPLEGYEDTYVRFSIKTEGCNIHMSTPHFFHSKSLSVGNTFSILYDTLLFEDYYKDNKYTNEGDVLIGIRYNSVTPTSLILNVHNFTQKKFKCGKSFKIYKGEGDGKELLEEFSVKTREKHTQEKRTAASIYLTFGSDKGLEPGIYT
ncbi:MAG: hypothetical protein NC223_08325, partial [Butyrivibrio sp.]|nr:hypothetical protein [Butyrivibrio sp.]